MLIRLSDAVSQSHVEAEFLLEVCFFSEALVRSEQGSLLVAVGYGSATSSTEVHNLGPEIASLAAPEKGSVCAVIDRGCACPWVGNSPYVGEQ